MKISRDKFIAAARLHTIKQVGLSFTRVQSPFYIFLCEIPVSSNLYRVSRIEFLAFSKIAFLLIYGVLEKNFIQLETYLVFFAKK